MSTLYYLDESYTNALRANGIMLDGTDSLEDLGARLKAALGYSDCMLIAKKSKAVASVLNLGVDFKFPHTGGPSSAAYDVKVLAELFPEFAGTPNIWHAVNAEARAQDAVVSVDGDIILFHTSEEKYEIVIEKVFKALCSRHGLNNALTHPVWKHYISLGRRSETLDRPSRKG